ncbi:urease accessory protein UreD [Mucilaginibacter sp. PPCGB 2223]|uniref:urease accessory protein UreD n=1 Tax=Mucilaginibacter sp. PPCGB 2223 TaxID=1886027 RepID=UPI0008265A5F|nr:urease accessory protein UreD [Mucilaginibacter sp. PPCGB 2223]OCX54442.1 urease accessory protein UreD [Mucilaginibacter sp. PPCGB 2223]
MIADLHIETKLRDGCTHLKKVYATPPFKIADVREDKRDKTLQLMMMSSSPGILDGDEYRIKIDLEEGCALDLQTQSYQRIFNMQGCALQQVEVHTSKGVSFQYLPHPSAPHEKSDFTAKNKIYLANNCRLIWGEVLTCGRKLNGEVFLFTKYHNLTEIFLNGKLIIKENLLMQPKQIDVSSIGQLEGYTHQASLIYLDEKAGNRQLKENINSFLADQTNIQYGFTEAPKNGIIIRILGQKGEQLHSCLKAIAGLINTKNMAYA